MNFGDLLKKPILGAIVLRQNLDFSFLETYISFFQVTEKVLAAVYKALSDHHVYLEVRMLVKDRTNKPPCVS